MQAVPMAAPTDAETPEGEAVALRARDDPAAFAELYVAHREVVFRYLRARCSNEDQALELAAMTFERAFVAMPRYRTSGGGVLAWLLRIARNAAIDESRREQRRVGRGIEHPSSATAFLSPEAEAITAEERDLVRHAVAQLPEKQREAVALRYAAGLTARQIGLVIGKSEEAAQKLVSRGVAQLREDLDDR